MGTTSASYVLTIGPEIYVSPNDQTSDPNTVTVRTLAQGEAFTIPPGQFAFLLTEESVSVPANALAFISIRAKTKFRGLVNVSGFHVDPGFVGQLTFAVFNAGPVPVHLKRGQGIFLIWYASLDRTSTMIKKGPPVKGIDPDIISGVAGELQSFAGLSKKIKDVDKDLGNRVHAIEKEQGYFRVIAGIAVAVLLTVVGSWIKDWLNSPAPQALPPSLTSTSSTPTSSGAPIQAPSTLTPPNSVAAPAPSASGPASTAVQPPSQPTPPNLGSQTKPPDSTLPRR